MAYSYIGAGLLSAAVARVILGCPLCSGTRAVILMAPVVEETLKTGSALLLNADIFYTHTVFGVVELVVDTLRRRGVWPGLVAALLHGWLGFVTAWLYRAGLELPLVLAVAVALHAVWNATAVTLFNPDRRKSR